MPKRHQDDAPCYILNLGAIFCFPGALPNAFLLGTGPHPLSSTDIRFRRRLTDEQFQRAPSSIKFERLEGGVASDFAYHSGALVTSRRAADIVEQLEPGVHQFIPLEVEAPSRFLQALKVKEYVITHVCQKIQAVNIEKSTLKKYVMVPPEPYVPVETYTIATIGASIDPETYEVFDMPPIVIDPSKITGHHLWGGVDPEPEYFRLQSSQNGMAGRGLRAHAVSAVPDGLAIAAKGLRD